MGMKRKKLYRFLAGLLCAGLLLADSSVGVLISTAAETIELETDDEEKVFTKDSGLNEENSLVDSDGIEGENSSSEGNDANCEENSTEDSDVDLEDNSTEEGSPDTENGSTEKTDTDVESDATEEVDADAENDSTEENDNDVEKDFTTEDDTEAKNDVAEDIDMDEEDSSIEAAEEDDSEIVEQSDETEGQPDEDETIPRVEFKVSDIYYFDATIDVYVYNCKESHKDFNIKLQNISEESEPEKINFDGFHVPALADYDMDLRWYFSDLEAGCTYKMWCDVEGVEQKELIFNTTSLDELTMDVEVRPRVSGAYIRARFSKPIMEADRGEYYHQYYPVLYYRPKGEKNWDRTINYSNVNKLDDYTIEVDVHNTHTETVPYGKPQTAYNDPPETEYEYAFEYFYARYDKTKSVLFVKDKQKVNGYQALDLGIGDYEYDTYTTTSLETAAGLITNTKWEDGAYTITASYCDRTAYYQLWCKEVGSSRYSCLKDLGVDNWAEWTETEDGYTSQFIFEEGELEKDKMYTYEFLVETEGSIITIETGIINTSGGTISGGSEDDSPYEDEQRTSLEDLNPSISAIKAKTYDGNPYEPVVKVTVTENGKKKTLTQDIDYSVSYGNNVNVGTGNVTIKGKGIYKGELSKEFKITPKSIKKLKIVAGSMAQNITEADVSAGTVELPVCVYDGNKLLSRGKDYDLSFKKSTAKTVTLNVESIQGSNYTGTSTTSVTIYKDSDQSKIITPSNVSFGEKWVYTGKAIKPAVKVWMEGKNLDKKNYKVQYLNNKNAGTAYVIVTGKGAYKGKVVKSFEILPISTNFTIKGTIKAKTYNGKLQKPSITVTAGKTTLKKNKDYKVSYIRNLHTGTAIVKVTGTGNYAGSCNATAAFTINPQKISKVSVKGTKTAGLTVTYGGRQLREGTDYTLDYGAETGNKVKVTITAKDGGDFTGGSVTKTVKIR